MPGGAVRTAAGSSARAEGCRSWCAPQRT